MESKNFQETINDAAETVVLDADGNRIVDETPQTPVAQPGSDEAPAAKPTKGGK